MSPLVLHPDTARQLGWRPTTRRLDVLTAWLLRQRDPHLAELAGWERACLIATDRVRCCPYGDRSSCPACPWEVGRC